jgi:Arc/MetJ family transcription regulator
MRMPRRTTIAVDDELLSRAQEALGTRGLKDTVEKAFHEAIRRDLLCALGPGLR